MEIPIEAQKSKTERSQSVDDYQEIDNYSTGWQWLNPLPQGNYLNDVKIVDANTAFAVGHVGTIMKTTNGGITWDVQNCVAGSINKLYGVDFIDAYTGTAVGNSGTVLHTTNGGITWIKQNSGTSDNLFDVSFSDANHGTAVGNYGTIIHTTDGGVTWQKQTSGTSYYLVSVSFPDPNNGTVVGAVGIILHTTDGGTTWTVQDSGDGYDLFNVSFPDIYHGTAVGDWGKIVHTSDGGETWERQWGGSTGYIFNSVCFTDSNTGTIVGERGWILRTTNSGTTWEKQSVWEYYFLNGVSFIDEYNGIAVGSGGTILSTTNGGVTWSNQKRGTIQGITDMSLLDVKTGVAVGTNGTILRTTNGGVTWVSQGSEKRFDDWYGVHFFNSDTGMAIGDLSDVGSVIYRTTDGGNTWVIQYKWSGSFSISLHDISFSDFKNGTVVGDYGTILRTTDGGITWTQQTSGTQNDLWSVSFCDGKNGIAGGWLGTMLHTTNGGATWTSSIIDSTSYMIEDVCLNDPNNGIAVDRFGKIYRTTDGCKTWVLVYQTTEMLSGISFYDENNGIICGSLGKVVRTTDGGATWNNWSALTTQMFFSCQLVPSGNGFIAYAAGSGGAIMCAAISPLSPKTYTWSGAADSSWNNPNNWLPVGVPVPGDSVIIAAAVNSPIIDTVQQQIVIASLNIRSGGKLTITDVLPRFVVLGDVIINGTLEIRPPAITTIIVGGNWIMNPGGGEVSKMTNLAFETDLGFIPYHSTVVFGGNGTLSGNFYNVKFDSISTMKSNGNIDVLNQCTITGDVNLSSTDTIIVHPSFAQAIIGPGRFSQGTIKRVINPNSVGEYRFESNESFVQFRGQGTNPVAVTMTSFPDTNIAFLGDGWTEVPSHVDTEKKTIIADSISGFSKWIFGIPRPTGNEEVFSNPDLRSDSVVLVKRMYDIQAEGGSGYTARLSLRYDPAELPPDLSEDSLKLYKSEIAVAVLEAPHLEGVPTAYALSQNYPNPFNPTTSISYQIPVQTYVTLKIYDVLGREIAILVSEEQIHGEYVVTWNASGMTSGVYFYRMKAGNFTDTKKLLLLR